MKEILYKQYGPDVVHGTYKMNMLNCTKIPAGDTLYKSVTNNNNVLDYSVLTTHAGQIYDQDFSDKESTIEKSSLDIYKKAMTRRFPIAKLYDLDNAHDSAPMYNLFLTTRIKTQATQDIILLDLFDAYNIQKLHNDAQARMKQARRIIDDLVRPDGCDYVIATDNACYTDQMIEHIMYQQYMKTRETMWNRSKDTIVRRAFRIIKPLLQNAEKVIKETERFIQELNDWTGFYSDNIVNQLSPFMTNDELAYAAKKRKTNDLNKLTFYDPSADDKKCSYYIEKKVYDKNIGDEFYTMETTKFGQCRGEIMPYRKYDNDFLFRYIEKQYTIAGVHLRAVPSLIARDGMMSSSFIIFHPQYLCKIIDYEIGAPFAYSSIYRQTLSPMIYSKYVSTMSKHYGGGIHEINRVPFNKNTALRRCTAGNVLSFYVATVVEMNAIIKSRVRALAHIVDAVFLIDSTGNILHNEIYDNRVPSISFTYNDYKIVPHISDPSYVMQNFFKNENFIIGYYGCLAKHIQ